jgi:hypothetical protein
MEKECLECSETFKGRVDKKFCSDLCRNSYNNKINSATTAYVRDVNSILRKNRKILEEFIPEQTAKASKAKLLQKGFNFGYYTSIYTNQKGTYFFCYEYGYLPLEQGYYLLVKRKE